MNNNFNMLDTLTVLAFIIGVYSLAIAVQNLEENRLQTDDTKQILHELNNHLAKQDLHLAEQDKLLAKGEIKWKSEKI